MKKNLFVLLIIIGLNCYSQNIGFLDKSVIYTIIDDLKLTVYKDYTNDGGAQIVNTIPSNNYDLLSIVSKIDQIVSSYTDLNLTTSWSKIEDGIYACGLTVGDNPDSNFLVLFYTETKVVAFIFKSINNNEGESYNIFASLSEQYIIKLDGIIEYSDDKEEDGTSFHLYKVRIPSIYGIDHLSIKLRELISENPNCKIHKSWTKEDEKYSSIITVGDKNNGFILEFNPQINQLTIGYYN